MKNRKHTPEQIIRKPAEGEQVEGSTYSGPGLTGHDVLGQPPSLWHCPISTACPPRFRAGPVASIDTAAKDAKILVVRHQLALLDIPRHVNVKRPP